MDDCCIIADMAEHSKLTLLLSLIGVSATSARRVGCGCFIAEAYRLSCGCHALERT